LLCMNGSKVCNGPVGPSPEICDGIDNDCNGVVDDVPGVGQACSGAGVNTQGVCTAIYVCNPASPGSGPGKLTCTQQQGPGVETCNGLDDDCDGVVDDKLTDPGVNQPCGSACPGGQVANCKGVCKAGTLLCVSGALVCQG